LSVMWNYECWGVRFGKSENLSWRLQISAQIFT
jgi:hypothetical protein